jgi:hypothetical protein
MRWRIFRTDECGTLTVEKGRKKMNDQWIEFQQLVEEVFREKPESPEEAVGIMMTMSDMIIEGASYRTSATQEEAARMS